VDREDGEERGAEGHEHVRPDAGGVAVDLALRADRCAEGRSREDPEPEIELQRDLGVHRRIGVNTPP
jgi:hypothetical protein